MILLDAVAASLSDPDAEDARRLLQKELSDRRYEAARPSWFDQLARSVVDWFTSLSAPTGDGGAPIAAIVGVLVIAAIVVAVLFITGVPRLRRRSALRGSVLEARDQRSAESIRAAAAAAARTGDWDSAVTEAFRAIARGLAERTIVVASPGTTAHGIAERASRAFPDEAATLRDAADLFDGVRYLGWRGDAAGYARIAEVDGRVSRARPLLEDVPLGEVPVP